MTITGKTPALLLAALLAAAAMAGCGDDDSSSDAGSTTTTSASTAKTVTGQFKLVPKAPSGFDDIAGTAKLVRSDGGTDVSIQLTGLKPDVDYKSHLHAGDCSQSDPGGPHFKFDDNGADTPPNEIHLPFTSDAEGNGSATARNDKTVPAGEGRSIVVHMAITDDASAQSGSAHSHPDKIACAQIGTAQAAATTQTTTTADSAATAGPTIAVKGKKPVGGIQKLTFNKGDRVQFTVTSDQAEEVHTHGYDIAKDVGPGEPATFDFKATIEGIFEVELEKSGVQIAKLTVNP